MAASARSATLSVGGLLGGFALAYAWTVASGVVMFAFSGGGDQPNSVAENAVQVGVPVAAAALALVVACRSSSRRLLFAAISIGLLLAPILAVIAYGWDGCNGCS